MDLDDWSMSSDDDVIGQLTNNLILIDKIIELKHLKCKPEFHILGGAALIFNGTNYNSTIDIDTANRIDDEIKEDISYLIDDMASEVVILPTGYISRLIEYTKVKFRNIKVFTLSNEDIVFTKLSSDRQKDYKHLESTNIMDFIDTDLLKNIVSEECKDPMVKLKVLGKMSMLNV